MSSAKAKSKKNASNPKISRAAMAPQLSIPGRKSKDRSAHVIGQENFKSAGEYYAFHDILLQEALKNRKSKRSAARKNPGEEKLKVKSEMDAFAETEMADIELDDDLSPPPNYEVDPDVLIPEGLPDTPVPLPQLQDVDPQQEVKPNESADNDDFIPISPVLHSIDESLSELIAIQTILTELARKRRLLIKRNKTSRPVAAPENNHTVDIMRREKKPRAAFSVEQIKIQEKKKVPHKLPADTSSMISLTYDEHLNATDLSDQDFEFPTEDDFMAYNGSPNDPMPIVEASDLVEFTSPSFVGSQNRQMSARSEILAQAEFSSTPPFSCIRKEAFVPARQSLDTILASKSEHATDEAWGSFHDSEFEAMHSTLTDTPADAHMESIDDWLNLTTNEVLPDDL